MTEQNTPKMTHDEMIDVLKGLVFGTFDRTTAKEREALDMAISALSAEPCREADDYENEIADLHNRLDIAEYDKERYKEEITTLEAKNKGEWIADVDKWGDVVTTVNGYTCSKCGTFNSDKDNFCPNCGADMRGDKERRIAYVKTRSD